MKSIQNRTSIRKYSSREVSDELLNRLLEEAERTPTMGNLQLYSVVQSCSPSAPTIAAPPFGQRTARHILATTTFSHS